MRLAVASHRVRLLHRCGGPASPAILLASEVGRHGVGCAVWARPAPVSATRCADHSNRHDANRRARRASTGRRPLRPSRRSGLQGLRSAKRPIRGAVVPPPEVRSLLDQWVYDSAERRVRKNPSADRGIIQMLIYYTPQEPPPGVIPVLCHRHRVSDPLAMDRARPHPPPQPTYDHALQAQHPRQRRAVTLGTVSSLEWIES